MPVSAIIGMQGQEGTDEEKDWYVDRRASRIGFAIRLAAADRVAAAARRPCDGAF